jgi:hypothetical protein
VTLSITMLCYNAEGLYAECTILIIIMQNVYTLLSIIVLLCWVSHLIDCYDECHYADCHYAECHYAECHNAKCHYAECHYAECHYAEIHYAECHWRKKWWKWNKIELIYFQSVLRINIFFYKIWIGTKKQTKLDPVSSFNVHLPSTFTYKHKIIFFLKNSIHLSVYP